MIRLCFVYDVYHPVKPENTMTENGVYTKHATQLLLPYAIYVFYLFPYANWFARLRAEAASRRRYKELPSAFTIGIRIVLFSRFPGIGTMA